MKKKYLFDEEILETDKKEKEEKIEDTTQKELDIFYKKVNDLVYDFKKKVDSKLTNKIDDILSDFKTKISNILKDEIKDEDKVEEKEESKKEKDELTFIDEDNQIFSEDEIKNLKWLAKQDIMDKVIELLDKNFSDNEEESETEDDKEEIEKEETKEDEEKDKVKDSFSAFNRNFRSLNDSSDDEIDTISEAWKNRKIKIN